MKKIQFIEGGHVATVTDRNAETQIAKGKAILFEEKEEKVKEETKENKTAAKRQTKMNPVIKSKK